MPIRVKLWAFTDRTFAFKIKPPPTSWFLKKITGLSKGPEFGEHEFSGTVSIKQIYEIAKLKHRMDPDLRKANLDAICAVSFMLSLG